VQLRKLRLGQVPLGAVVERGRVDDGLDAAHDALARGASTVAQVRAAALHLLSQQPELTLEYLDLADPRTLEALPESAVVNDALLTIAVGVDDVRLLDERLLGERSAS
jgi:pantothenate synthetase